MSDEQTKMITVIHIRPGKIPQILTIEDTLAAMQKLVGGMIQEYMPFYSATDERIQDIALICNDESKLRRMMPNREIYESYMEKPEVIRGDFFLCYAPYESETFLSMPEDLQQVFYEKFYYPEIFFETENGIEGRKYEPLPESMPRQMER